MAISLTRLSGGNTPADGSDPRTFPAIWNASATAIEGALADTGASVTVSETAPVSPNEGDLWLNSTEAKMYVYYDDGTSAQWVAAVGGTVPQQGKIVAVKHALFTGTQSASVVSGDDLTITDLSITHEVASASNKLIISGSIGLGASSEQNASLGLAFHDGSGFIGVGDAASNRPQISGASRYSTGNNTTTSNTHFDFVHTPGAGSKTYTLRAINLSTATRTLYVNRTEGDSDTKQYARGASSLVIMEVAV